MKKIEEEKNRYRTLIGAYYGVTLLDEYKLKAYVLKDIELLIRNFIKDKEMDFKGEADDVKYNVSPKVKLQDAFYVLNEIDADKELLHVLKIRLQKM